VSTTEEGSSSGSVAGIVVVDVDPHAATPQRDKITIANPDFLMGPSSVSPRMRGVT
jgi:hypothetical protein